MVSITKRLCWLGIHNTPKDHRGYKHATCFWCGKYILSKYAKGENKAIKRQKRVVRTLLRKGANKPIVWTEADRVVSVDGKDVNYIKAGKVDLELDEAFKKLNDLITERDEYLKM